LDASGAGLVSWLAEIGVTAMNNGNASWTDIIVSAGYQPMVMGGRFWYHWTGVRMAGPCFNGRDLDFVALANPAPGWMDVGQYINSDQFEDLGTFSAVWFTDW
jgi:hypothetical protein